MKKLTERLLDIIKQLPEEERLALMKELEKKPSKRIRRKHNREPFLSAVDYSIDDHFYRDFLCNISVDGAFIETQRIFITGKEVSMTFPIDKKGQPLKITGTIARVSPKGIGIKFKEVDRNKGSLRSLIKWLRE